MGIPGLSTYVQERKNLTHPIRIDSIKYAIIDGWAIFFNLFQGARVPTTYGGEYQTMKNLLVSFVNLIRNLGVEPIFVIDSFRDHSKLQTIVGRYQDAYQESLNILKKALANSENTMSKNQTTAGQPFFALDDNNHPTKCNSLTKSKEMRDILHEINCEIWTPVTDGDPLVVHTAVTYAKSIPKNNNYNSNVIIVSNDSDFYIFPYPENVFYCNANIFYRKIQEHNQGKNTRPVFYVFNQKKFAGKEVCGFPSINDLIYLPIFLGSDFHDAWTLPEFKKSKKKTRSSDKVGKVIKFIQEKIRQKDGKIDQFIHKSVNTVGKNKLQFLKSFYNYERKFAVGFTKDNFDYDSQHFQNFLNENRSYQKIPKKLWQIYFLSSGANPDLVSYYVDNTICKGTVIEDYNHSSNQWLFGLRLWDVCLRLTREKNDNENDDCRDEDQVINLYYKDKTGRYQSHKYFLLSSENPSLNVFHLDRIQINQTNCTENLPNQQQQAYKLICEIFNLDITSHNLLEFFTTSNPDLFILLTILVNFENDCMKPKKYVNKLVISMLAIFSESQNTDKMKFYHTKLDSRHPISLSKDGDDNNNGKYQLLHTLADFFVYYANCIKILNMCFPVRTTSNCYVLRMHKFYQGATMQRNLLLSDGEILAKMEPFFFKKLEFFRSVYKVR